MWTNTGSRPPKTGDVSRVKSEEEGWEDRGGVRSWGVRGTTKGTEGSGVVGVPGVEGLTREVSLLG